MVRIATASGKEGWVDLSNLLSPEQMKQIQRDHAREKLMPSQGAATAFETLNFHIEPSRRSPAIGQISEGVAVEILGRMQVPKNALPVKTSSLVVERRQPNRRPRKEQQAKGGFRPPMKPPPPKPPANWQQLSAERIGDSTAQRELDAEKEKEVKRLAAAKAAEAKRPVVMEDWTLIRTKSGETGWALTRNLLISVPDEVAQYAEGKRITSYFELGSVTDEDKGLKHHWLWTTLSGQKPLDFDSWRVFIWNARRHRYETSFRQRDLTGYFPIKVDPADPNGVGRTFHIVTKDDDDVFRKRSFRFDGTLVRLTGKQDLPGPPDAVEPQATPVHGLDTNGLASKAHPGWFRRQWNSLTGRFGGR
jgi:hypothetical protein